MASPKAWTQRPNCTAPTRAKARSLEVTWASADIAIVVGHNDRYEVRYDGLTCDCPAYAEGRRHCSHVLRAIAYRATGRGASYVHHCGSLINAAKLAHMEGGKGHATQVCHEHGYFWVEVYDVAPAAQPATPAPAAAVPTAPTRNKYADRTSAQKQALVDELF